MRLKISDIIVANNRRGIDDTNVRQLAESIREVGLLNLINVTKTTDSSPGRIGSKL